MVIHKKQFKKDGIEYYCGQNNKNSRVLHLWADNSREFDIGYIDNKTDKFYKGVDYDKLPEKSIKKLIEISL